MPDSSAQSTPSPHTEVVFVALGSCSLISDDVIAAAASAGFALFPIERPLQLAELNELLMHRSSISLIVGDADRGRLSLVNASAIAAAHFPPLMLALHEPAPPSQREAYRRAGVMALVDPGASPQTIVRHIEQLGRSWSWTHYRLGRIDAATAIQALASLEEPCCLTVACPHVKPLLSEPWSGLQPCSKNSNCKGWYGRLYLRDGRVQSAETPHETGIPALRRMLELDEGQLIQNEVTLWPPTANVDLPMDMALLQAAAKSRR